MKLTLAAILALFLLMPGYSQAQTPVVIEGLQVIAERQYATDPGETINVEREGVFLASARVYEFDDANNAESTWETLVSAETVTNDLPTDDESVTYETLELENVGDRAIVLSLSAEMDGGSGAFRTVIIQNGTIIITVTVIASSTDAAMIADEIAIAMSDREPADSESEYDGLGGSTGGVWEVFLPADAGELGDLVAYADKETRPA